MLSQQLQNYGNLARVSVLLICLLGSGCDKPVQTGEITYNKAEIKERIENNNQVREELDLDLEDLRSNVEDYIRHERNHPDRLCSSYAQDKRVGVSDAALTLMDLAAKTSNRVITKEGEQPFTEGNEELKNWLGSVMIYAEKIQKAVNDQNPRCQGTKSVNGGPERLEYAFNKHLGDIKIQIKKISQGLSSRNNNLGPLTR